MTKKAQYLAMAMMGVMMSQQSYPSSPDEPISYKGRIPKYPKKDSPQKGQFHYWFRADGTFLNEKQDERMRKDECVFVCYSINDKNAIRKFNAFIRSNQADA
jgi:hypothetical protein